MTVDTKQETKKADTQIAATIGQLFNCTEATGHEWEAWNWDIFPSQMTSVSFSYQWRQCSKCGLVERTELGMVATPKTPDVLPVATNQPKTPNENNVLDFKPKDSA